LTQKHIAVICSYRASVVTIIMIAPSW